MRHWRDHSIGASLSRDTPTPRGSWPSNRRPDKIRSKESERDNHHVTLAAAISGAGIVIKPAHQQRPDRPLVLDPRCWEAGFSCTASNSSRSRIGLCWASRLHLVDDLADVDAVAQEIGEGATREGDPAEAAPRRRRHRDSARWRRRRAPPPAAQAGMNLLQGLLRGLE